MSDEEARAVAAQTRSQDILHDMQNAADAQRMHYQDRITSLEMQLAHATQLKQQALRRAEIAEKQVSDMLVKQHTQAVRLYEAQRHLNAATSEITPPPHGSNAAVRASG